MEPCDSWHLHHRECLQTLKEILSTVQIQASLEKTSQAACIWTNRSTKSKFSWKGPLPTICRAKRRKRWKRTIRLKKVLYQTIHHSPAIPANIEAATMGSQKGLSLYDSLKASCATHPSNWPRRSSARLSSTGLCARFSRMPASWAPRPQGLRTAPKQLLGLLCDLLRHALKRSQHHAAELPPREGGELVGGQGQELFDQQLPVVTGL
mmetsp:Transcript_148021/g.475283  ORF Transcript_148021/g.475283 Transcript_148021/m.475283 type:complete len:208 (+) Transcript_148021:223-846(+)